jgi:hypothetical protein
MPAGCGNSSGALRPEADAASSIAFAKASRVCSIERRVSSYRFGNHSGTCFGKNWRSIYIVRLNQRDSNVLRSHIDDRPLHLCNFPGKEKAFALCAFQNAVAIAQGLGS